MRAEVLKVAEDKYRIPINTFKSEVRDIKDKLRYIEVGGYNNVEIVIDDNLYLKKPDLSVKPAEDNDPCEAKVSVARFKTGYSASGWHLGLKCAKTLKQYKLKIVALVGLDENLNETVIEYPQSCSLTEDLRLYGIFNNLQVQFIPHSSGVKVKHTYLKDLYENYNYKYFGLKWEVNDIEIFEYLQEFTEDFRTFFKFEDSYFTEYFDRNEFTFPDGSLKPYIVHYYTTKSGSLSSNETWTAGTYYVTDQINLAGYCLTFDCSSGPIYIKVAAGSNILLFYANVNNCQIKTINTSLDNRVYATSSNDDTIGETISGSTGSPAPRDYMAFIWAANAVSNTLYDLSYLEIRYAGRPASDYYGINTILQFPYDWNYPDQASAQIKLDHIWFKYCALDPAEVSSTYSMIAFIGTRVFVPPQWYLKLTGESYIRHIYIDDTNEAVEGSQNYPNSFMQAGLKGNGYNFYIEDCFIQYPSLSGSGTRQLFKGLYFDFVSTSGEKLYIRNNIIIGDFDTTDSDYTAGSCIGIKSGSDDSSDINVEIRNNLLINPNKGHGIYLSHNSSSCSMNVIIKDNTLRGNLSNYGICKRDTGNTYNITNDYNGYYNWNQNCYNLSQGSHSFTADPQLGNNPTTDFTISDECVFPNGYFIKNLSGYEGKGSDTFDNLGIDENTRTATGYKYNGADKITPGANYFGTFSGTPTPSSSGSPSQGEGVTVVYQPMVSLSPIRKLGDDYVFDIRVSVIKNSGTYFFTNTDYCSFNIYNISDGAILASEVVLDTDDRSPDNREYLKSNIVIAGTFTQNSTYRLKMTFNIDGTSFFYDIPLAVGQDA